MVFFLLVVEAFPITNRKDVIVELKFVAATKPGPVSANVKRRQKLVQRIDQQIGYCEAMKAGQMPRAAWTWMDEAGSYFVPIKYGRQHVELGSGLVDQSQKMTVAAKAMAERKTVGHRS